MPARPAARRGSESREARRRRPIPGASVADGSHVDLRHPCQPLVAGARATSLTYRPAAPDPVDILDRAALVASWRSWARFSSSLLKSAAKCRCFSAAAVDASRASASSATRALTCSLAHRARLAHLAARAASSTCDAPSATSGSRAAHNAARAAVRSAWACSALVYAELSFVRAVPTRRRLRRGLVKLVPCVQAGAELCECARHQASIDEGTRRRVGLVVDEGSYGRQACADQRATKCIG